MIDYLLQEKETIFHDCDWLFRREIKNISWLCDWLTYFRLDKTHQSRRMDLTRTINNIFLISFWFFWIFCFCFLFVLFIFVSFQMISFLFNSVGLFPFPFLFFSFLFFCLGEDLQRPAITPCVTIKLTRISVFLK